MLRNFIISAILLFTACIASASDDTTQPDFFCPETSGQEFTPADVTIDTAFISEIKPYLSKGSVPSLYDFPYSRKLSFPDRKRIRINSIVFLSAYVGTLAVLECLPEGATNWNKATIQSTPWYKRWWKNVIKRGPEWDGDDAIFNYVLHPYAGAVYFMAGRSAGLNFYQSLLYCLNRFNSRLGIRNRRHHGAPVDSGYFHHTSGWQRYRRMFL